MYFSMLRRSYPLVVLVCRCFGYAVSLDQSGELVEAVDATVVRAWVVRQSELDGNAHRREAVRVGHAGLQRRERIDRDANLPNLARQRAKPQRLTKDEVVWRRPLRPTPRLLEQHAQPLFGGAPHLM
jgi:hypothetical protein